MQRRNVSTVTSSSVKSAFSTIPSPVTALQSVSENQGWIVETLSRATTHDAEAAAAHERISWGTVAERGWLGVDE